MTGVGLLRTRERTARVPNVELFFDLVYVFAVTQLSHYLLDHRSVAGALQAALLLAMVWLAWAYTAWVTNWLEPQRIPVRLQHESQSTVHVVRDTARSIADILKLRWNWMNRRFASPALSDIYIADMPVSSAGATDAYSKSATIRATASSTYG